MRDPLDDLRNLAGDLTPRPLPAEEVRRRGERMRRRRTFSQAVGAAAAVAVVASGGVLLTGSLSSAPVSPGPTERSPSPTPSPTTEAPQQAWLTSIPDGFPLDLGLPAAGGDVPEWEWSRDVRTALDAQACGGSEQASVTPMDGLRVEVDPPDEQAWRHLLLFEDDTAASEMLDRAWSADGRCLAELQANGGRDDGLTEVRWSVEWKGDESASLVAIEGKSYAWGTETRVPGRSLMQVAQVGNALLVAHLSDASSTDGKDSTTRDFSVAVAAVVDEMCVFAADPCGTEAPEVPAGPAVTAEDAPYVLTADHLDEGTRLSGWAAADDLDQEPIVCAEESTEALAGDRTDTREFAVLEGEEVRALAITTVLDFDDVMTFARDGYERAAGWLTSCDEPVDRRRRISSAGDPYGEVHTGRTEHGPWTWRTVTSTAPEICRGCDTGWNNHQAVLVGGERLVMVQVSYRVDLQSSVDDSDSPFPGLIETAARLAAEGGLHPEEAAALVFRPTGIGEIRLGMSRQDLERSRLVRGPVQGCQAFDAKNLRGPSNGYVSDTHGVVMLSGEPPLWTPEGIGFGSTRSEVEEAYGELRADSRVDAWRATVPGHSGTSYAFTFDEGGVVVDMALWKDDQDCVR
jgi:hypothetical protein